MMQNPNQVLLSNGLDVGAVVLDFEKGPFSLGGKKSFGPGGVLVHWTEVYIPGRVSRAHVGGEHSGAIPICTRC